MSSANLVQFGLGTPDKTVLEKICLVIIAITQP